MPRKPQRPRADNHHWKEGVLRLKGQARVPLYWTPDPQHSPVLRTLTGNESVKFVPEIKFGHWVIVRMDHQLGWVDLRHVEILETEPFFEEPPPVSPQSFLENAPPRQPERDTQMKRPPHADERLRRELERQHNETVNMLQPKEDNTADEPESITLSRSDVNRLIGYMRGIKDVLRSALGRNDESGG